MYPMFMLFFFFNDTATTEIYPLSLHDALPVNVLGPGWVETAYGSSLDPATKQRITATIPLGRWGTPEDIAYAAVYRSEEHTSELQSRLHLVCRLLLEKKKKTERSTRRRRRH